jgi:hypothetical protein
MSLELLGSRLLAPVYGNSIFVWGSLIGVVLSALSAGYYLGGKLADVKPSFQILSTLIFVAGILVLALPAVAPPLFGFVIALNIVEQYSPLLATTLLLGPPSLLLGTVSPYAIRLVAESVESLGKASGNLYALSTLRDRVCPHTDLWGEQDHLRNGRFVAGNCVSWLEPEAESGRTNDPDSATIRGALYG